ncbi:hypothetical protein AJ80_00824 [Polytolypa hystricis UAMH7299]|uniref:HNH domain-containing protein n=1 Tax=Polytolypa hystricis (strain UAMH7299) TaxID=1447883 RepID=A0A2B7Z3E9_POLH7|nr:hypothetical protein AJ80_00824 [Polytolypa hystricis UAMH7299]
MGGSIKKRNFETFRECVSQALIQKSAEKPSRRSSRRKTKSVESPAAFSQTSLTESNDPEELAEFIDYIAGETFSALPKEVQTLSYSAVQENATSICAGPLSTSTLDALAGSVPLSVSESLSVYGLVPDASDFPKFLEPILNEYITSATAPPPVWSNTRTSACEICARDWIPLSYHHLIPKAVHAKILKRKWHEEWMLNSVAWLCRACHNFVHQMASNEELAKEWYTIERILQREDVQAWASWVSKIRWKAR